MIIRWTTSLLISKQLLQLSQLYCMIKHRKHNNVIQKRFKTSKTINIGSLTAENEVTLSCEFWSDFGGDLDLSHRLSIPQKSDAIAHQSTTIALMIIIIITPKKHVSRRFQNTKIYSNRPNSDGERWKPKSLIFFYNILRFFSPPKIRQRHVCTLYM